MTPIPATTRSKTMLPNLSQKRIRYNPTPPNIPMGILPFWTNISNYRNWVWFASPKVGKSRAVFSGATIRRNPTGKYFISIVVEKEGQEWPKTHSSVGVDVVLKDFAVLSDGKPPYPNPKFYRT
jgi:hypothetical protein